MIKINSNSAKKANIYINGIKQNLSSTHLFNLNTSKYFLICDKFLANFDFLFDVLINQEVVNK